MILTVDVSETGGVTAANRVTEPTPFDGSALEAAQRWNFRPASRVNRDVAARAFFMFTFVQP